MLWLKVLPLTEKIRNIARSCLTHSYVVCHDGIFRFMPLHLKLWQVSRLCFFFSVVKFCLRVYRWYASICMRMYACSHVWMHACVQACIDLESTLGVFLSCTTHLFMEAEFLPEASARGLWLVQLARCPVCPGPKTSASVLGYQETATHAWLFHVFRGPNISFYTSRASVLLSHPLAHSS